MFYTKENRPVLPLPDPNTARDYGFTRGGRSAVYPSCVP